MSASPNKQIDIAEDIVHQQREWKVERIGWIVMATVVLATSLGVFGRGVLSDRTIGEPGSRLQVHYQQYERYRSATTLKLQIMPEPAETSVRVVVGREFLDKVRVTEYSPDAESVEAGPEGHTYEFNLTADDAPASIYFFYEPFAFGSVATRVGLENSTTHEFRQFIFP